MVAKYIIKLEHRAMVKRFMTETRLHREMLQYQIIMTLGTAHLVPHLRLELVNIQVVTVAVVVVGILIVYQDMLV